MIGGDGESNIGMIIFYVFAFFFLLGLIGTQIYLNVRFYKNIDSIFNSISEIKSKIGSLIKEINQHNRQEYLVEMEQQANINILNNKVSL